MSTVLGSCIAVCISDPVAGVGGMNHFLLPGQEASDDKQRDRLYGSYLMELLLNGLYKRRARKENMQVKLFGGAKMFESRFDPGKRNAEFILKFVADEGLKVTASSLGGNLGRRIEFVPVTGQSRQKRMAEPVEEQRIVMPPAIAATTHGELELF